MEMDYIKLDGVSNATKGIVLLDVDLPDTDRKRAETPLLDSMTALESEYWDYQPGDIPILMAVTGSGFADLLDKYQDARRWITPARRLEFCDLPGYYFWGSVTKIQKVDTNESWIKFKVTFRANPSCTLRALSQQSGFIPSLDTRIPEQITAANATCSGSFSAPGILPEVPYAGAYEAAMYMVVTGTWTTLAIGGAAGFTINWAAATSKTVYINCELEEIYYLDAGQMVDLRGVTSPPTFPRMTKPMGLLVGGTNTNMTVRLLVIERG
jgi:hypothetical protein